MIEQRGRFCPELSDCVGGMETVGRGREERKKSAPLTRQEGTVRRLAGARAGREGS